MKKLIVVITCLVLIGSFNANAQLGLIKKAAKKAKKHTVKTVKKVGSATKTVGKTALNGTRKVGQYGASGVRTAGSYGLHGARSFGKGATKAGKYGATGVRTVGRGVKTVGKGSVRGASNMVNSSVGKAIVRTVSAPGKSVYNATEVVRGKAGVGSIYKPYMEAVVGNVKVAAKTVTTPHRVVYRRVKKAVN
jgi:hypothetical protein